MADRDDDVRVPRKWFNAFVAGLIAITYALLQQGWEKMVEIDKHLTATDVRAYADEQRLQNVEQHLADPPKPVH